MVITELLERNARLNPAEIALVELNPSEERDNAETWRDSSLVEEAAQGAPYRREMNWGSFDRRANRVANFLLSRGVKRETKVGILLMNSLEWLPVYFGVLKAGCIVVPMNYRYTAEEIRYCVDLADVEVFIFGPEFTTRVDQIKDQMPKVKMKLFVGKPVPEYAEDLLKLYDFCSFELPPIILKENDLAAIYFSSGTTGFPKAILHSHRSLIHAARVEQAHHQQTRDDVFLCIPPFYHTGAKMHWFGSLISDSKAVILRGVKPDWIFRAVSEEKCTIVWLLVPWAQDILDEIDAGRLDPSKYMLDQWRLMHIGAQPVPPALIDRWEAEFPNHKYDTNYGLSESIGPGCVHLGMDNIRKVGAIGIPGFGWEAKVIDGNGNEVPDGTVGELAVKGPGVMLCYYKNPEATAEILHGDWLWTGDMAKKDEDGFIWLVDRKKDVIISGGENIYPVEIESFLRKNNKIKDCAVIGYPDQRLGEITLAVIELKEGEEATREEIELFCMELPRYKRPRMILFDKIPRNPTGKIEKPVLRKKYSGECLVEAQTRRY